MKPLDTLSFAKPKPVIDEDYLAFVRSRGCCVIGCSDNADAHHVRTVGAGRNDYTAIPLCRTHHSDLHKVGEKQFKTWFGIDVYEECVWLIVAYTRERGKLCSRGSSRKQSRKK